MRSAVRLLPLILLACSSAGPPPLVERAADAATPSGSEDGGFDAGVDCGPRPPTSPCLEYLVRNHLAGSVEEYDGRCAQPRPTCSLYAVDPESGDAPSWCCR